MIDACTPSLPEIAATLHARFAGHVLRRQAETGVPMRRAAVVVLPELPTRGTSRAEFLDRLTGIKPEWIILDEVSPTPPPALWESPVCVGHSRPRMIDVTPKPLAIAPPAEAGDDLGAIIARALDTEPAPAEAGDGGSTCPTCEGDCMVPACTDPACDCHLDTPCREVACPTCGGLGSV